MGDAPARRAVMPGPRLVLEEVYRFLPGIAMAVAGLTIVVTVAQALQVRNDASAAVTKAAASVVPTAVPAPADTPQPAPTETALPTAAPVIVPPPAPTATPLPGATMDASSPTGSSVRLQGRIRQPSDQLDYWFMIREPGREGVFRQGPVPIDTDGSFVFLLSLIPLDSGPDSVTLAAVPKDISTTWLQQAISSRTWLPVIDVQPVNGISFLSEVRLAGA